MSHECVKVVRMSLYGLSFNCMLYLKRCMCMSKEMCSEEKIRVYLLHFVQNHEIPHSKFDYDWTTRQDTATILKYMFQRRKFI